MSCGTKELEKDTIKSANISPMESLGLSGIFIRNPKKEAMNDRQSSTGKELDEIEKELRQQFRNITLAKIVDQYNYGLAHPF